jgi:c-di-GMP-binding flagellar brake protein YcgR
MKDIAAQIFSDEHRLTTRKRAAAVLREICEQHERVNLLPNGSARDMGSILLGVDEAEDWIMLDMPMPEVGLVELAGMEPLMGVARYAGVYVGFQVEALEMVDWRRAPALKARFPAHVYFLQRRQYYRVQVRPEDLGTVQLVRLGAATIEGRCHDLSAGGMRMLARPPQGDFPLRDGEHLAEVQFELKGTPLKVQGRIQHIEEPLQLADGSALLPIGVEFTQKPPNFEQTVARYVQERDRELLAGR